jgi:hypothetical protein
MDFLHLLRLNADASNTTAIKTSDKPIFFIAHIVLSAFYHGYGS